METIKEEGDNYENEKLNVFGSPEILDVPFS
jgi:hypothetical protein